MNSIKKAIKHRIQQVGFAVAIGFACAQPSFADDTPVLQQIQSNTQGTVDQLAALPVAIVSQMKDLMDMAKQMITTKDPNNYITNSQGAFATVFNDYANTINQQQSLSQQLTNAFLTGNGTRALPNNANELNYGILTGALLNKPSPTGPQPDVNALSQNYLSHVAGIDFALPPPNPKWGSGSATTQYTALYNDTAAIASYNSYLLAGLYQQQDQDTNRLNLIKQASDSSWFANIQAEDIGLVIRQILMYTSQMYADLDRLLKIQQQQLAAIAMTNTLLLIYASTSAGSTLSAQAMNQK